MDKKITSAFFALPMSDGENRNARGLLLVLAFFAIKFEPMVDNVIAQ